MAETAPRILVGCAELPPGRSRTAYFQSLRFLEAAGFFTGAPSLKAVRTWREKSPDTACFALLASKSLTFPDGFGAGEAAEREVERMASACAALRAEAVVFRTPASFSPSTQGRARCETFFGELATAERFGNTERVWQPDGLWEADTVAAMCESAGVLAAIDLLATDPLGEDREAIARHLGRGRAYVRISGIASARRRVPGAELEELAAILGDLDRAWVAFGNPEKFRDALELDRLLGQPLQADEA